MRPYASPTISAAYFAPSTACFATVVATRFTRPAARPAARFALAARPPDFRRGLLRAEDFLAELFRAEDFLREAERLAPPRFRAEDFLPELFRAEDFLREERFNPPRLDPDRLDPLRFLPDRFFVAMLKSPKWGVGITTCSNLRAHTSSTDVDSPVLAMRASGWRTAQPVKARRSSQCGRDSAPHERYQPRRACDS